MVISAYHTYIDSNLYQVRKASKDYKSLLKSKLLHSVKSYNKKQANASKFSFPNGELASLFFKM